MKTHYLAALAVATLTQATGCIIVDDDEPTGPGQGQFSATWTITENGTPLTCADVGADRVEILSTLAGSTVADADRFPCDDGGGTTVPLVEGSYTVQVSLLAPDDSVIFAFEPETADLFAGAVTDLGEYPFTFNYWNASFSLQFGDLASQCDTVVQQVVSVFEHNDLMCIPLFIDGLDQSPDPYHDTCTPNVCQTASTVQTVIALEEGQLYDFEFVGLKGAALSDQTYPCWIGVKDAVALFGDTDFGHLVVPWDDSRDTAGCPAGSPGCNCNATKPGSETNR